MFSIYLFIDVVILFSDSIEGPQQTITNRPSTSSSSQGMSLVITFSACSLSLSLSLSLSFQDGGSLPPVTITTVGRDKMAGALRRRMDSQVCINYRIWCIFS